MKYFGTALTNISCTELRNKSTATALTQRLQVLPHTAAEFVSNCEDWRARQDGLPSVGASATSGRLGSNKFHLLGRTHQVNKKGPEGPFLVYWRARQDSNL